jgi:hypothetical protein
MRTNLKSRQPRPQAATKRSPSIDGRAQRRKAKTINIATQELGKVKVANVSDPVVRAPTHNAPWIDVAIAVNRQLIQVACADWEILGGLGAFGEGEEKGANSDYALREGARSAILVGFSTWIVVERTKGSL